MSKAKKLIDGDYVLEDGCAWFEVENISIRIHKTDEGVVVDLYPKGREDEDAVASTYMYFSEADDSLSDIGD